MLAAVRAARAGRAARIIVAVPVGSPQAAELLAPEADQLVILQTPAVLFAIGEWYERFEQLEDEEVCRLLRLHRRNPREAGAWDQTDR
jgi:predicted phosphoribosyltransferase